MLIPAAFGMVVNSAVSAVNVAVEPHVDVPVAINLAVDVVNAAADVVGSYPPFVYPLPELWVTLAFVVSVVLAMPFPELAVDSRLVTPTVAPPCVCAGHAA